MFARRILGLDVGSFAAKAVELRQTLRGLEVVQLRHLPFDDPSPGVASELRELIQAHNLPVDKVVVSLAGDRISTRRLDQGKKKGHGDDLLIPHPIDRH